MEAAGLVLAVLPLITSTTENLRRIRNTGKTIFKQKDKDEKLGEDLNQIHLQVGMLEIVLEHLIKDLPLLSAEKKRRLIDLDQDAWKDPDLDKALAQKLGQEARKDLFVDCMGSILRTLDSIISDKTLRLLKTDLVVC